MKCCSLIIKIYVYIMILVWAKTDSHLQQRLFCYGKRKKCILVSLYFLENIVVLQLERKSDQQNCLWWCINNAVLICFCFCSLEIATVMMFEENLQWSITLQILYNDIHLKHMYLKHPQKSCISTKSCELLLFIHFSFFKVVLRNLLLEMNRNWLRTT